MDLIERRAARFAGVVLAGLLLLLVTSCGTISAFVDLSSDLSDAGFSDVNVNVDSNSGGDVLRIDATAPPGDTTEEARRKAAEIAWKTFPRRFESLQLDIGGTVVLDRSQLEAEFGPRPAGLDDKALEDDVRNIGIGVLIALGIGFFLCVGLIILIIVLVRRSGKKKRAQQQQQWGGPGYGQPPYGQPGYAQPPQYGQPQQPSPQQQQPPGWGPPPGQQQQPPPPPGQNPPGWG
jgi:hypothetical protein